MLHTSRVDYANDISIASSMFGSTTVHIRRICQQPKRYAELAGVGITLLMHRGRRRAVEGIVTSTAFLSSTILLAKAIVLHQLALRDYLLYVSRISRGHRLLRRVAARHQGRQAPRGAIRLDPRCGPDGASLTRRAYSRRGATNSRQTSRRNIKYSRYQDIARMGRRGLARGAIFTALLAVLYYI